MQLILCLKTVQTDWQTRPSIALLVLDQRQIERLKWLADQPVLKAVSELRENRGADAWCGVSDVYTESNFLCLTRDGMIYLDARDKHSGMILETRPVPLASVLAAFDQAQKGGPSWAAIDDETRDAALADVPCTKVEYDLSFFGGDYHGVGQMICIPNVLVDDVDTVEAAFTMITSHPAHHIVHYSLDESVSLAGEEICELVD